MPAASEYRPDDKAQREAADKEFKARQSLINKNQKYYDGDHKKHLKIEDGIDDNVTLNLCQQVIDDTIAFLAPNFPTLEFDKTVENDDELYLRGVWSRNDAATLLLNIAHNGSIGGQMYTRVIPGATPEEAPRIINLNPANIITWWHDDDRDKVLWYELQWSINHNSEVITFRQDVVAELDDDGNALRWNIYEYVSDAAGWKKQNEDVWPYPLSPICSEQHLPRANVYYGQNEIPHAGLNDAVNKVASDINRILRFHAFPKTLIAGVSENQDVTETAINGVLTIEDSEVKVHNIEMQSDLASSMRWQDKLEQMFCQQARVVKMPADLSLFRSITNLGIRAAFMPMTGKSEVLRRQYTKLIVATSQVVMLISERDYTRPLDAKWGQALPMDRREMVDLVSREQQLGYISKRTAASDLGRDYEEEKRRMQLEMTEEAVMISGAPIGVSG